MQDSEVKGVLTFQLRIQNLKKDFSGPEKCLNL